jgi:acetyl-CoA synthetase
MPQITSQSLYEEHYKMAKESPEKYWENIAGEFEWFKKWDTTLSGKLEDCDIKWFEGGKTNLAFNCLDRHLKTLGNKKALIFEPNNPNDPVVTYTYKELHEKVCQFSNVLESQGVKKGDRVCFYMSMVPELLIGVMACARVGAIHSVVFGGFSAKALSERINDCGAKILITNDGGLRGAKVIPLKEIADEALKSSPIVEKVIVYKRAINTINFESGRDLWWHELTEGVSSAHTACEMDSEDPLFILYTSGSTGRPKGLLHTTAGYMVYAGHSFKNVFQLDDIDKPDSKDVFWCTADIGWITGHTYLTYGPLLNGATTVMFEGVPTFPDAGRFWQAVEKHKVTHFYTAPTAIRALQCQDINLVRNTDLSSLKVLGTVGEPINEEAWQWYKSEVGKDKCPIVDTWWQTETGGVMITSLPGVTQERPCYATLPLPGIRTALMDSEGKEITTAAAEGNLCIEFPWPSMARTIWGDHARYKETYFSTYPGYYFTGDGCKREENNFHRITGRVDDVINVSGHRLGTAEIEDAINQHEDIVESAVVGYPHDIKGQGIYAFVICYNEQTTLDQVREKVNSIVNDHIGAIARPDKIQLVKGLPKTRSGKIMRRILRKVAEGNFKDLGDTSTLLDPSVVDDVIQGRIR